MAMELTSLDRALLELVQRSVPLVRRPFAQLAAALAADQEQVIRRVAELSRPGGVIREIAGIFDATAMGFSSALVAGRLEPSRLAQAGRIIAAHPGVSHCYSRDGLYNLWFTLVVPPNSRLGLAGVVELLGRSIGAERILSLPSLRRYKLQVHFGLSAGQDEGGQDDAQAARDLTDAAGGLAAPAAGAAPPRLSDAQVRAVRALQEPLPAEAEPFERLAQAVAMSGDDLLAAAADLLATGALRRYSAVLRHRAAGSAVNVMVAWQAPAEQADAFGARAASDRHVSHCYLRPAAEDWPYNLYTMIHARTDREAQQVIRQLAGAEDFPRAALATVQEFKKAKVKLFSPEFQEWEKGPGTQAKENTNGGV